MKKIVAVTALVLVAVLAIQVVGLAQNPTAPQSKGPMVGGQPGAYYGYVPVVPVPPGVIAQYGMVPCATPNRTLEGRVNVDYLVRELGEGQREWRKQ